MQGRAPIGCCMIDYSRENTTRKGEGEKNKMPRKKFSHSKFLKQKLRQKMVKISTGLTLTL